MTRQTFRIALASASAFAVLLPGAAFAHTDAGSTSGFVHGFAHPVSGLDHIFAMVLIGMLAFQFGGGARWLLPAAFVATMAAGGALGVAGIELPMVETGIALSVVVLGMMIALSIRTSTAAGMAIAGVCAIFHGYAHGTEMPGSAGGLAYAAGFMTATALLHAAGLGLGFLFGRFGTAIVRTAGGLSALVGLGILTGAV